MKKISLFIVIFVILSVFVNAEDILSKNESYVVFNDKMVLVSSNISEYILSNYTNTTFDFNVSNINDSQLNCSISGIELYALPNSSFTGNSYCLLSVSNESLNISDSQNITFQIISLSSLFVTDYVYVGGSSSPNEIVIDVYNNTQVINYVKNVQTIFGDKIVISKGDTLFDIYTAFGSVTRKLYIRENSQKTEKVFVKNNGLSVLNIDVSCVGECSDVSLSNKTLSIEPSGVGYLTYTIDNVDYLYGDNFDFKVRVTDSDDKSLYGDVSVNVVVDEVLGYITDIVSYDHFVNDGLRVGNILIPTYIFVLVTIMFYFLLVSIIFRKMNSIVYELLRWLGSIFLGLIIILII